MQTLTLFPGTTEITPSRQMILDNDQTIQSCFAGVDYPTTNLLEGQFCFRTDHQILYQYTAGAFWKPVGSAVAVAATYYVSTTGNDTTNTGASVGSPFLTIQKAFDTIKARGTVGQAIITFANGMYAGNLNATELPAGLTIIIQPTNPGMVTFSGTHNISASINTIVSYQGIIHNNSPHLFYNIIVNFNNSTFQNYTATSCITMGGGEGVASFSGSLTLTALTSALHLIETTDFSRVYVEPTSIAISGTITLFSLFKLTDGASIAAPGNPAVTGTPTVTATNNFMVSGDNGQVISFNLRDVYRKGFTAAFMGQNSPALTGYYTNYPVYGNSPADLYLPNPRYRNDASSTVTLLVDPTTGSDVRGNGGSVPFASFETALEFASMNLTTAGAQGGNPPELILSTTSATSMTITISMNVVGFSRIVLKNANQVLNTGGVTVDGTLCNVPVVLRNYSTKGTVTATNGARIILETAEVGSLVADNSGSITVGSAQLVFVPTSPVSILITATDGGVVNFQDGAMHIATTPLSITGSMFYVRSGGRISAFSSLTATVNTSITGAFFDTKTDSPDSYVNLSQIGLPDITAFFTGMVMYKVQTSGQYGRNQMHSSLYSQVFG